MFNTPESKARQEIDTLLQAAGWVVQNQDELYLYAGRIEIGDFDDGRLFEQGGAGAAIQALGAAHALRDLLDDLNRNLAA